VFAVAGVLVDKSDFDKVSKSDALELGPGGFIAIRAIVQGDAIDAVESAPIASKMMFMGGKGRKLRGSGCHWQCLTLWSAVRESGILTQENTLE
jgi:hypothetical protein